jgi:hypothetical protein
MRSAACRFRVWSITKFRGLLASALLVAIGYGRALGFGFARSEDTKLADAVGLVDGVGVWHGLMLDLSRLGDGGLDFSPLWRPTVNLAYLIAGWIGGGEAWAFRLLSLAILVVMAWTARRMMGRSMGRDLVLILVIFHPMMSAAVLDVMAMPSLLMALCVVMAVSSNGRAAFFWTLLGMGAHEAAAVIPIIAMAFRYDHKGERRNDARWQVPLLAVVAWWGMLWGFKAVGLLQPEVISLPTVDGLAQAAAQVWLYMGRLVMPISPVFARTDPVFTAPWPALAWIGLLFLLWAAVRADQPRSTPMGPGFSAGLCSVLLALLAAGGLVSETPGYGEGRLALPIVGLAWVLASRPTSRLAAWTLVPMCVVLTILRVGVWSEPNKLWAESHTARPQDTLVSLEYGTRLISTRPTQCVALMQQVLGAAAATPVQRYKAHVGAIQAWFEIGNDKRALPHLSAIADPDAEDGGWLLVRRCILETRFGFDERGYPPGTVKSPLARVCGEAARRYPRHARLANAAGVEAAIRGDAERAQFFIQRAVELAPHNGAYRRSFSLIPMNVIGFAADDPLSPDRSAAP